MRIVMTVHYVFIAFISCNLCKEYGNIGLEFEMSCGYLCEFEFE
jgi:hypothetical protein